MVRIILFPGVVVLALPTVVLIMLVKVVLALPMAMVGAMTSRLVVTSGTHVQLPVPDQAFESAQPDGIRQAALAQIAAGQPARLDAVLDVAGAMWTLWQRSMVSGDAGLVRPIMSEGQWRLHQMLLDVRSGGGVERIFDGRVLLATVIAAVHSPTVDEVQIRLEWEGRCYDRHHDTGILLRGSPSTGPWSENLTLRRAAEHDASAGIDFTLMSSCPNCGAPIDVDADGTCRTCSGLVAPAPGDWVGCAAWRAAW